MVPLRAHAVCQPWKKRVRSLLLRELPGCKTLPDSGIVFSRGRMDFNSSMDGWIGKPVAGLPLRMAVLRDWHRAHGPSSD